MRILKGWTTEEREELEDMIIMSGNSILNLFDSIIKNTNSALNSKYCNMVTGESENQLSNDIVDYFNGKAKFPETKYYVHFVKGDIGGYLNFDSENGALTSDKSTDDVYKTQFTKSEINSINPNYLPFIEKVPVEELED